MDRAVHEARTINDIAKPNWSRLICHAARRLKPRYLGDLIQTGYNKKICHLMLKESRDPSFAESFDSSLFMSGHANCEESE